MSRRRYLRFENLETREMFAAFGDFNGDGALDAADIDKLVAEKGGDNFSLYDLTRDEVIDDRDVSFLITEIFGARMADVNLDLVVDARDFNIWNSHKFERDTGWASGDINGNGMTDASDFGLLHDNLLLLGAGWHHILYDETRLAWRISDFGEVFQRIGDAWQLRSERTSQLVVNGDGRIWARSDDGVVREWSNGDWEPTGIGKSLQLAVAANGNLWSLSESGEIYERDDGTWVARATDVGTVIDMEVDRDGVVWALSYLGDVFSYDETGGWHHEASEARRLEVNEEGELDIVYVTVEIINPFPSPGTSVDEVLISFSEPITGFSLANLSLFIDGEPAGPSNVFLNPVDPSSPSLWLLSGLTTNSNVGNYAGEYRLLLANTSEPIIDADGHPLYEGADERWLQIATITFTGNVPAFEGDTWETYAYFTISTDLPFRRAVEILFTTHGLTATPDVDFVAVANEPLIFPSSTRSMMIQVVVIGDELVEGLERFLVSIVAGAPLEYLIVSSLSATGLIQDNDF